VTSPRKALILVDDEKAYVDLLAHLLSDNLGCAVFTFTRARDALKALPDIDVGCVITDFHMPDINGYEFIRRAAEMLPGVPFILISGHAVHLMEDRPDWPAAMRALVPKPFSWRKLAEDIYRHAPEFALPPVKLASS
jgi:two-component SAPR family response regulator